MEGALLPTASQHSSYKTLGIVFIKKVWAQSFCPLTLATFRLLGLIQNHFLIFLNENIYLTKNDFSLVVQVDLVDIRILPNIVMDYWIMYVMDIIPIIRQSL